MRQRITLVLALLFLLLSGNGSRAQTRDGEIQLTLGVGAGLNPPVRLDLDLKGEYFLNDRFSTGLNVDVFVRGRSFFNFLGFGRYHFEFLNHPRLSPYIGWGLGALVSGSGQGWFDLMAPELGVLFELTPHLYLGPNASLHILAGSSTTWDLQALAELAFRF